MILVANHEQLWFGAGQEWGKITADHRWGDTDESGDPGIGCTGQQTYAGAKRVAQHGQGGDGLAAQEIRDRSRHVLPLSVAAPVDALAGTRTTEVEAQGRNIMLPQRFGHAIHHIAVHIPTMQWMGMAQHDPNVPATG